MKNILNKLFVAGLACSLLVACEKDEIKTVMKAGVAPVVTLSPASIVLTQATEKDSVETISWSKSDYGFSAVVNYTVQIAKAGTNFANPQQVNMGNKLFLKLTGGYLNTLAISVGIGIGSTGQLDVRLKSSLSDSLSIFSEKVTLNVTTYQTAYPALMVQGGNGWLTPATRTDGFVMTSPDYSSKYEGYFYLPNADGYGGDALKLVSTSTGVSYGWGSNGVLSGGVYTASMVIGAGNLWFTPAPNYIKVNTDLSVLPLKVTYVPVKFYISGDHNSWSTSATPMTYNPTTRKLVATNVSFTAGNKFVFTCNGGYDISYKVDATGKLVFSGPPAWAGNNINAPATGVFTVTLDLSPGNGLYTYSIN